MQVRRHVDLSSNSKRIFGILIRLRFEVEGLGVGVLMLRRRFLRKGMSRSHFLTSVTKKESLNEKVFGEKHIYIYTHTYWQCHVAISGK